MTRVVEADGGAGTGAASLLQALTSNNGANLYPRKAQPSDPTFVYPLFPKDALYTFLKLDTENLESWLVSGKVDRQGLLLEVASRHG